MSIRKTGTHLIKELMTRLGYAVYGDVSAAPHEQPVVRDQELMAVLGAVYREPDLSEIMQSRDKPAVDAAISAGVAAYFASWRVRLGGPWPTTAGAAQADPDLVESLLASPALARFEETPGGLCWFVHDLDLNGTDQTFLDDWLVNGEPRIILGYRDPRDAVVSMVNFLSESGSDEFARTRIGAFPEHRIYREILMAVPTIEERINIALTDSCFPGMQSFERALWLRRHPRVCAVAFEDLVGPKGGGSSDRQSAAIAMIADSVGVEVSSETLAPALYNESSFTFRTGKIGGWRDVFTPTHEQLFAERYGHLLDAYTTLK